MKTNLNQPDHRLKTLPKIISGILAPIYLLLIYKFIVNDDWNRNERILFVLCLGIGFINLLLLYYQKWREKKLPPD